MKSNIVGELRQFCTDWDGSKIPRNAEPMDGIHCGLLIDAADEIERLRKELATAQKDKAMSDGLLKIAIADCNTAMNDRAGAIRATLEHYRDNVSEEMARKGMNEFQDIEWPETAERVFISMITQAIKELDE